MKKKTKRLPTKYARKVWTINPKTRVKGDEKKYNRKRAKKEFKKEIEEFQ